MRSIPLFFVSCFVALLALPSFALGLPNRNLETRSSNSQSVSTVYQFPNVGSWIEGIAVRPNGNILVTRTDVPELWSIDPNSRTASVVYTFPNATSTVGITAIGEDVYAVGTGIVNLTTTAATPGSFVIWKVDLSSETPKVTTIKAIPEGGSLDGMAYLQRGANTNLLIADTLEGVIWRLDPQSGNYSVAMSDQSMLPAEGSIPIGINGVRIIDNYVYYTSSTQQKFCRVAVADDGSAAGPFEVIATGFFQDGFAIAPDGTAYIATHPENTVVKVTPQGEASVFAGNLNSTEVAGSTDVQFSNCGYEVIYVATNGAQGSPVNGTYTEPAKVVMIVSNW
ncbi:hypothetical protein NFIA_026140 [Paecilomyces variotii No. 5]|uniref:SMP-30/Gluconolactonase/LRE-like region domain-containing protein n=1 Tax=Byssochlamys spectabilis (strain No. 5 / NBRC 109023) TaxID=1356009 RepID=V5GBY1_BYSSN|nr:hypothetical protein NFIA_026140 [Paecilomyces variotii No. 5]